MKPFALELHVGVTPNARDSYCRYQHVAIQKAWQTHHEAWWTQRECDAQREPQCEPMEYSSRWVRGDVTISTYKTHTNHKRSSVRSHTLAPTSICDLSHSLCWSALTDLGHINSVTYVCHPLWLVCGHRKGILTSPLSKGRVRVCHVHFMLFLSISQKMAVSSHSVSECPPPLEPRRAQGPLH